MEIQGNKLQSSSFRCIIEAEGGACATIGKPIEQRNTGKGNPSAILHFSRPLNKRQEKLLKSLPDYDSRVIVNKGDEKMSMPTMTKENIALQKALAKEYAISYCKKKGYSIDKLSKQRIDIVMGRIVFSQPSGIKPQGLLNDMDTIPTPTLVISFNGKELSIEETEHANRYLS